MRYLHLTLLCVLCALPAFSLHAEDAIFQYHATVLDKKERPKSVFLWIPPEADRIRGILASTMTLMEAEFSSDPIVRAACAEQGLAILFSKMGLEKEPLQQQLDAFAEQSGYSELKDAPLFFVGHSAGGGWANRMAQAFPERCLGLMTFRGGLPWGAGPEIPSLVMVGQYDEFGGEMRTADGVEHAWEKPMQDLIENLKEKAEARHSFLVEPGTGHFAWSQKNAEFFAAFLRACAEQQLKEKAVLERIPYQQGWILPLEPPPFKKDQVISAGAKPDMKLIGSWFPTRELAEMAVDFQSGLIGKQDQFIRWENRHWVDAGARFFFMGLQFEPGTAIFSTSPVYAEKVPGQYDGKGPKWHHAGEAVQASGVPIEVKPIAGPLKAMGDGRLAIRYSTLFPQGERNRMTFLAMSAGNDQFRHTEQVGMAPRGYKGLRKGKAQVIQFPELPKELPADSGPIELGAHSDSGLDVQYYIAYGPAKIENGQLILHELPTRATFPVELKVVATQPGSGKDPVVQQAAKVEQLLQIVTP